MGLTCHAISGNKTERPSPAHELVGIKARCVIGHWLDDDVIAPWHRVVVCNKSSREISYSSSPRRLSRSHVWPGFGLFLASGLHRTWLAVQVLGGLSIALGVLFDTTLESGEGRNGWI
jgi:hypothetical protein